jgi:hypothetical protein
MRLVRFMTAAGLQSLTISQRPITIYCLMMKLQPPLYGDTTL